MTFAFGQWIHGIAMRREQEVYRVPLTVGEVVEHFPDKRIEFLEQP